MSSSDLPLKGIRVIDLTRVVAGPTCTMILGDMGAEIIKVELPNEGDITRHLPPIINGESTEFVAVNRNKKSITLNMKTPEGLHILKELIRRADIFILNLRTASIKSYGITYEDVQRLNPRIIYCLVTGYGETGPYADRPAYDYLIQAETGLMGMTGEPDGPPLRCGIGISDVSTGLYSTIAILGALHARNRNGKSIKLSISLFDATLATLSYLAQETLVTGIDPPRTGLMHPSGGALYSAYFTKDNKLIAFDAMEEWHWKLLCEILGLTQLMTDSRFDTYKKRVSAEGRKELAEIFKKTVKKFESERLLGELMKAGVPCGNVNMLHDALAAPQVRANNMLIDTKHPLLGDIKTLNTPIRSAPTIAQANSVPPLLGQHTDEVLEQVLHYDASKIAELRKKGVL